MGMPHLTLLFERIAHRGDRPILNERGRDIGAAQLLSLTRARVETLRQSGIGAGDVCVLIGDYGVEAIALMLALASLGAVVMPLTPANGPELPKLITIAGARWLIRSPQDLGSQVDIEPCSGSPENALIQQFRDSGHGGLIVFTSGSSGEPKGILHDFERIIGKFVTVRPTWRMILFLAMDHFGGINTLFGCLSDGGVGICIPDRTPEAVCTAIETSRAELLPTTPTFLKMLLASDSLRLHDLSSLRLITYGAEPMPAATLQRVAAVFPKVRLKQTYGLSELGVLRSSSAADHSVWLKVGGDEFETRVVDHILHIRSQSNMIGYLNAPSPISQDGWLSTGDIVEQRNGMIRFLGRASEIINVGGQKVFPSEVENVLLEAHGVVEATVYARQHPLLGQAVCARVSLREYEDNAAISERLRAHCQARLAKFKVPLRFDIVQLEAQSTKRSKKQRPSEK